MKKGIIMEKRKKYVIVLTKDGSFQKTALADKDGAVGDEIDVIPYCPFQIGKPCSSYAHFLVAALVFALILSSFHFVGERRTYAYVNVDINPSIQLEVSESLDVHGITAVNSDAEELVRHLHQQDIWNLKAVISEIMSDCEQRQKLENGKEILIGVSYTRTPDQDIVAKLKEYFHEEDTDWQIITFRVPDEVRARAAKKETSMNREFAALTREEDNRILEAASLDEDKMEKIHSFYGK